MGKVVLMDANAIIGANKYGVWEQLRGRFVLETVEMCVVECASGDPGGWGYVPVDTRALRTQIRVHDVTQMQIIAAYMENPALRTVHEGERDLLVHALGRADAWLLTSQDKGCLKCSHELGFLDRMVSLEELARETGNRIKFEDPYSRKWLDVRRADIRLGVL